MEKNPERQNKLKLQKLVAMYLHMQIMIIIY